MQGRWTRGQRPGGVGGCSPAVAPGCDCGCARGVWDWATLMVTLSMALGFLRGLCCGPSHPTGVERCLTG